MNPSTEQPPAIQLDKILVPTDFSEASRQAFPCAVSLARQFGASITLVYIMPTTLPAEFSHIGVVLETKRLVSEAGTALIKFRERELPADLKVEILVLEGGPFYKICEAARTVQADLIVIATHGHTGLKHFLLGSTAERVVRFAPCPVLTVRTQFIPVRFPETCPSRFRKIIVPIDFSDASEKALPYVASFAQEFGAEIRLLHVIEPSIYYQFDSAQSTVLESQLKRTASLKLNLLLQSFALNGTAQVRIGPALQEIIQEAADQKADLIILSTHGRTGLKHVFLGSTAENVVRHASCPVLVVRQRQHEFLHSAHKPEDLKLEAAPGR